MMTESSGLVELYRENLDLEEAIRALRGEIREAKRIISLRHGEIESFLRTEVTEP